MPMAEQQAPPPPTPEQMEDTEAEEGEESTSALIPKSILGGMELEPGQEITLKVVKVYGDEVEVQPVVSGEPTETKAPVSADQEIDDISGGNEMGGY